MKKIYAGIEVYEGLVDCFGWACVDTEEDAIKRFQEMDMAEEIVVIQVPDDILNYYIMKKGETQDDI